MQRIECQDRNNIDIAGGNSRESCSPGSGTCVESLWRARPPGFIAVMITMDIADPFARQLMARYLANRESDLHRLKNALSKEDFRSAQVIGHNMHGSGSSYGLDLVSEIGQKIELAAENADSDRLESLISQLHLFIDDLRHRGRISAGAGSTNPEKPDEPVQPYSLSQGDSNLCKG